MHLLVTIDLRHLASHSAIYITVIVVIMNNDSVPVPFQRH